MYLRCFIIGKATINLIKYLVYTSYEEEMAHGFCRIRPCLLDPTSLGSTTWWWKYVAEELPNYFIVYTKKEMRRGRNYV